MFDEVIESGMQEAKSERLKLSKFQGILVEKQSNPPNGLYLENYANCLFNRQLDIFDDAMLLLEHDRIPSACIISRGMIETYAIAKLLTDKVYKILQNQSGIESVNKALETVLQFTNSSRLKVTEQKKVEKGVFDPKDYQFTEQAKSRIENMLADSEHVMDALRFLYKEEIKVTKAKESQFEITYDSLSEWVHPSQTSVFHNYVTDTHLIPTSIGELHLYDGARMSCMRALCFITDSKNVHDSMLSLATEISQRSTDRS